MKKGSIIWYDFGNPPGTQGHEQQNRRPAVVLSNEVYNGGGLCVIAPVTHNRGNYPFYVPIPAGSCSIDGVIIADQARTIDWRARGCQAAEGDLVPKETMDIAVALYKSIIDDEDDDE